jgi:hypothetical protein
MFANSEDALNVANHRHSNRHRYPGIRVTEMKRHIVHETPLAADQGVNLGAHICQLGRRYSTLPRGMAASPVEALHLISQDDALRRTGNNDLKGVILYLCCQRAAYHQARFAVVGRRAKDKCRPVPALFAPRVRRKVQPHDITGIGYVRPGHYQTSLPCARPESTASCWFPAVIPRMRRERS